MVNVGDDAEIAQHRLAGSPWLWFIHGANIGTNWLQIHCAFGLES